MRRFRLEREQFVPIDRDTTFHFFSDARNLERLTPPWLHFEIVSHPTGGLSEGSLIEYRLRLRGFPFRWRSKIAVWDPPDGFMDVQVRGPYRLWEHAHGFEALNGGTVVRDVVEYAVPGGALIDRFLVRSDLDRIFDYRAGQLNAWALSEVHGRPEVGRLSEADIREVPAVESTPRRVASNGAV